MKQEKERNDFPQWFSGGYVKTRYGAMYRYEYKALNPNEQEECTSGENVRYETSLLQWNIVNTVFDHTKMYDDRVTSEPYHLYTEQLEMLLELCKQKQFDISFSGESEHYPGRTFLITITPRVRNK